MQQPTHAHGRWLHQKIEKNILGVEDGVGGVQRSLVLGGITDEALLLGEGNERRSNTVTLLVGNCGETVLVCCGGIFSRKAVPFVATADRGRAGDGGTY